MDLGAKRVTAGNFLGKKCQLEIFPLALSRSFSSATFELATPCRNECDP